MTAIPRDPPADVAGLRTLGTGANQAMAGNDPRIPPSGALTIKASYLGTPGVSVFYTSTDLAGNTITSRTTDGVTESASTPGLYFYDQVVSLDQFEAIWDENDGSPPAKEVIATRHLVGPPAAPTSVTATGGDTSATVSFTPGDNGGSAILSYIVTAVDSTNAGRGGQVQSGSRSPLIVTGLTNGDHYTFTVTATTAIGTSPASAASNMVIPAVVLRVPDAPTGISAVVSGSGQVTVTFTAPANNGGSAITSYLVSAVDETNSAHNTTHVGNSPNVVTALVNGEAYHFTVHAVNAVGAGAESVASNTVTPSGSGGIATFTYTQPSSTTVLLDATGSTGTLTWNVDGVDAVAATTTLLIGPLTVGSHHIKLTAVSGGAGITERDINVAWVARPLGKAQHDPTNDSPNGIATQGWWGVPDKAFSSSLLPTWADLPVLGPWRNTAILNMAEGYPGAGDGTSRLHIFDDNHVSLLCKYGDHPGTSGGYRASLEMNDAYGSGVTYVNEFATHKSLQVNGQNIPLSGGNIDGHSTDVRFYRISIKLPTGTPNPLLYQNNLYELFGVSDGAIRFNLNGAGTQIGWTASEKILGANAGVYLFDFANLVVNQWYDYVGEVCWNTDRTVGYIRVYRDTGTGMQVIALSRCPAGTVSTAGANYGKFFYASQQTNASGVPAKVAIEMENYRDRVGLMNYQAAHGGSLYPDTTIEYQNCIVGPTLASVMV